MPKPVSYTHIPNGAASAPSESPNHPIVLLQNILCVERELKNLASGVLSIKLPPLYLAGDLLEAVFNGAEIREQFLEQSNSGGEPLSHRCRFIPRLDPAISQDLSDLIIDPCAFLSEMRQANFGIVRGTGDEIGQSADHDAQAGLGADEPQVLLERAVEEYEHVLCVRRQLKHRLVPAPFDGAVQPACFPTTPSGQVVLGFVAQGVRMGCLHGLPVVVQSAYKIRRG